MKTRILIALVLFPAMLCAQEFRGTISGTVTDQSGAVVPMATVTATETQTGTKTESKTTSAGRYTLPFLLPGTYEITTAAPGFKKSVRAGVRLQASEHLVIDVRLTIGSIAQSVEVTAAAPMLNTSRATIGQVITTKEVADLPLNGRAPMMLAGLAIGVSTMQTPGQVHPFDNNALNAWVIGGTPDQTSEVLLDGAPDEIWSGAEAYSPPMDAVQEVTVDAFDTDAAYGHTFGGVANQITKSGTNRIHGEAYEYTQASALDANNFFSNEVGSKLPVTHYNQYGFSAGGPVVIPNVYNGRNKLFWFFAWEGLKDSQPEPATTTVPTTAERQGDFSALYALGSKYELFDPYNATQSGTTITRQPYPEINVLTSDTAHPLNSVALAYLNYFPAATPGAPVLADGADNYFSPNGKGSVDTFNNELARVDYNMSDQSHLYVNFRHNLRGQAKNNIFPNIATGTTLSRLNWGSTVDEVYTFTPTMVADIRANWTYMKEVHGDPSQGFDPTTLGFPSYITAHAQQLLMPPISFSSNGFQNLGNTGDSVVPSSSYQLFGDVVTDIGKHSLKYGADVRQYRLDAFSVGSPVGSYSFGTNWMTSGTGGAAQPFGADFASFLLGLPTGGSYTENAHGTFRSNYYALFLQDNWRLRPNLTLNLGLRYEEDTPYGESYGRSENGFAFGAANPIQGAAQTAFATDFPSGLAVGAGLPNLTTLNVPGGLTFASPGNTAMYNQGSHIFSPRLGFAWSPSLWRNTVIRGGFGIFVEPITLSTLGTNGNYSSNPVVADGSITDQEGFSASTPFTPTSNNYLTPAATLSDPFPGGSIFSPTGSSAGLSTYLGQTVWFLAPHMRDPYSIRWNIGYQHTFTHNLLFEVDYVGNRVNHLPIQNTNLNTLPLADLCTNNTCTSSSAFGKALSASVTNPFSGLIPGSLGGSKISVAQLLAAYPEFPFSYNSTSSGVIMQNNTSGSSWYNALDMAVTKRLSHGLSLIGNYSDSRMMEEDTYLNFTDTHPERRISPFDFTYHFSVAAVYDLPFGPGRSISFNSHVLNGIFGGWVVNGIYAYQTGNPVLWSNGDYLYNGGTIQWNPRETAQTVVNGKLTPVSGLTNGCVVFDCNSKDQLVDHVRTFPSTIASIRYDGISDLDSSILRNIRIKESAHLQIRFEVFNTFNHPQFDNIHDQPDMNPTKSDFGVIKDQTNAPRGVQMGARLIW